MINDEDLVKLYIFAWKWDLRNLENEAVSALTALHTVNGRGTSAAAVNKAYAEIPRDTPLIACLIEEAESHVQRRSFPESTALFCAEYIGDVFRQRLSKSQSLPGSQVPNKAEQPNRKAEKAGLDDERLMGKDCSHHFHKNRRDKHCKPFHHYTDMYYSLMSKTPLQ